MRKWIAASIILLAIPATAQQKIGSTEAHAPGVFTNVTSNCASAAFVNHATMAMFQSTGLSNYTQDAVCGAVVVPQGATNSQSNGVSGMVDNYSNGPVVTSGTAGMGGYFQLRQYGLNTSGWGINTVGIIQAGATGNTLLNEVDFDNFASGSSINGWAINAPYWDYAPTVAYGVVVTKPGCSVPNFGTYPATGCPQWTTTFNSYVGASQYALAAYERGTGSSQPSQNVLFCGKNAGGTELCGTINVDLNGNLILSPTAGGKVSIPALDGSVNPSINAVNVYGLYLRPAVDGAATKELYGVNAANNQVNWAIDDLGDASFLGVKFGSGVEMTANHGNGTSMQHSDGTGASGNLPKFDANGNVTDSSTAAANLATKTGGLAIQSCATGSITPGTTAGATATGTCTLSASATGHAGVAAATDGSVQGIVIPQVSVNGTTATVTLTTVIAGSPTAKSYNVTVF
jgi:hypothetical protein